MIAVLQRVKWAKVGVEGKIVGQIGPGLLVLAGISKEDDETHVHTLADKLVNLRIFRDDEHNMNRSLLDVRGSLLVVSQFTLLADSRKGRRPSFTDAASPDRASALLEVFVQRLREHPIPAVETGEFGAMMDVSLCNDGPVTVMLDSRDLVK